MSKLNRQFFMQDTLTVAKSLIGSILVFNNYQGIITETEAYIGENDPACHAAKGRTKRTEVMYGPAGFSYVYLIYGMYYCLNIVTEQLNFPAAVLIRGIQLINSEHNLNLDGPGKLCKYLGINKNYNNIDLIKSKNFYVKTNPKSKNNLYKITATPRIGIKVGTELLWRFKI